MAVAAIGIGHEGSRVTGLVCYVAFRISFPLKENTKTVPGITPMPSLPKNLTFCDHLV